MAMALERSHPVVPMPRWSNIIGCARAVVAILVLAFTAAATGIWGGSPPFDIALFTSSATLFVFAYYFVALSYSPALYNRWAVLTLESIGTLLWLVSLATLSGWSAHHSGGPPTRYSFWNAPFAPSAVGLQSHPKSNNRRTGIAFAGTAAGLSGFEMVLFAITLTTFGIALDRQREEERKPPNDLAAPASSAGAPQKVGEKDGQEKKSSKPSSDPIVV